MKFDIITIFPQIFNSYFRESIVGRAQEKRLIKIVIHDLRDFTNDKRRTVDDKPFGGGPGMILKVEPIYKALQKIKSSIRKSHPTGDHSKGEKFKTRVILFSAKGKTMTQADARRLSKYGQLIVICGRYEGVDERVAKHITDEEISVGNYVLTGGEIPAMIMVDAVSRLVPGVLGKKESLEEESFSSVRGANSKKYEIGSGAKKLQTSDLKLRTYLEYPQYTRPEEFMGWKAPKVLLGGNHKEIERWRNKHSKAN